MLSREKIQLSAREVSRILAGATLLSGLIYLSVALGSIQRLQSASDDWRALEATSAPRGAATIAVIEALGYGGLIHSFKNTVIRADLESIKNAQLNAGEALGALTRLDFYMSNDEDRKNVEVIRSTVREYLNNLSTTRRLVDAGAPAEVIDETLFVDDGPAKRSIEVLLKDAFQPQAGVKVHARTRSELLVKLRHALGYSGMIHQFKNVVLRNDPNAMQRFKESVTEARSILNDYRKLDKEPPEITALDHIEDMLGKYELQALVAFGPIRAHRTALDVDEQVRINDLPALTALKVLDRFAAKEIADRSVRFSHSLKLLASSNWALSILALIIAVTISLGALWLIDRTVVRPAGHVAGEIRKLADGNLNIELNNLGSNTELGTIASATTTFRDALIKLDKTQKELERSQEMAAHDAQHDSLTGLANRRYLDRTLSHISDEHSETSIVRALHIDLDRFKQVNDTYGHAAGDFVLCHVAETLQKITRGDDFVARVGGDEFTVICAPGTTLESAEKVASRIVEALSVPVVFEENTCQFGASIGLASVPANQAKDLVLKADIALYNAKRSGRGKVTAFRSSMQTQIIEQKRLADELATAVEKEEIVAFYQPQFSIQSLDFSGVEALTRWRHPTNGCLTLDQFLEAAREIDKVAEIDQAVFQNAERMCQRASMRGLAIPRLGVTVSSDRLMSETLIADLAAFSATETSLSLELQETTQLDLTDQALFQRLDQIRELGVRIDIDDFGSERASITNLVATQPDRLKIDKALIQSITCSPVHRSLVESIILIAQTLSIDTVADGVETIEQLEMLRRLGCTFAQGGILAKPMKESDLVHFLSVEDWRMEISQVA